MISAARITDVRAPHLVRAPVMFQNWESLTFLHWPYAASEVAPLLPRGLRLHLYDDRAWVGLVPFRVTGLRPPLFPALPWLSAFPETNVRTYVVGPDGYPGVWFFTLDAARLLAVLGGRFLYGLPYRWASMRVAAAGQTVQYRSRRRNATTDIAIRAGERMPTTELETFLTARYRLYSVIRGRLAYADVEHEPWPLYEGTLIRLNQSLVESCGLPSPRGRPLLHYSPGVRVAVARPKFAA